MNLTRFLAVAALLSAPLAAQQVVEWSAASGALPGDVAPRYGLWQTAPCGAPVTTLSNAALTIDTAACAGQIQSYQYVRSPGTTVTFPAVHWAEARVRLHPAGAGSSMPWGVSLSLYPGPVCAYTLTLREGEVSLATLGLGVLGSIAVDTTSAPRTWRIEVDYPASEARVRHDGQVVLVVPLVAGPSCSFAPGFFGGVHFGDLSQGMSGVADWFEVRHNLGVPVQQFCGYPALNSVGQRASLQPMGSLSVAQNSFVLTLQGAPPGSFGYLLCSRVRGDALPVAASQGTLCLHAPIGRFNRPGEVLNTGAFGAATLALDLSSMPQPGGAVAAMPGERWSFQFWYRDSNPGPTSNLSSGLEIHFE